MLRRTPSRGLTTSLFTDIVGSTAIEVELGDQRWHTLQAGHHAIVRKELKRFHGHEVDTAGDGFFATFTVPADGVRCAAAIAATVQGLGLEIRAGLHTGETELTGEKAAGIAVHIAARVSALAGAGEVLVTRTLAELVAGSGFGFSDRGEHELKGVPGEWRLLALSAIDGEPFAPNLDPEAALERRAGVAAARQRRPRRRLVLVSAVAIIALVAATLPFVLHRQAPALAADGIQLIDATSGQRVGSVLLPGVTPGGIVSGAGYVWVSDEQSGTVVKIDPDTRAVVDTISVGPGSDPAGIAYGDGAVWVALSGDGKLARIEPSSTGPPANVPVGNGPTGVAYSSGSVWVTNYDDDTVVRVDTTTDKVVHTVDVGSGPVAVAANGLGAWVANAGDGTVTRIPSRGPGIPVSVGGSGSSGIAIGSTGVWVTNSLEDTLSQVPATGESPLMIPRIGAGPTGVTVDNGTVWVADHFGEKIARVDATNGAPAAPIQMDAQPVAMTLVGGELWVAASAPQSTHRGGTLTFASELPSDSIDPATAYSGLDYQFLSLTNDGLVGFNRVGGPPGGTVVPDLATSVPPPSTNGMSYTFHLRPDIHYSNEVTVKPADFKRGIERAVLLSGPASNYYSGIVGAASCHSAASCDLTGIVPDAGNGTVTFNLKAPDPEFLYKLALPFADAVPADTPLKPIGATPLPATGPYKIASYTPEVTNKKSGAVENEGSIVLMRNRHFVQWSQAAQPAGYSAQIDGSYGVSPSEQTLLVEQGRLDVMDDSPPTGLLGQLNQRYPTQLHEVLPPTATEGFALNTKLPPFSNPSVRRALNFAVNRKKMVTIAGGSQLAQVSCQILTPGFPGYKRNCPYTKDPSTSGRWLAPNLRRAHYLVNHSHTLVNASGTGKEKIRVWTLNHSPADRWGKNLVLVLDHLGYLATLKVVPGTINDYFNQLYSPKVSARWQVSFYGWEPDYPTPWDFLAPLFGCPHTGSPAVENTSHFCNPGVQADINSALAVQDPTEPATTDAAWAGVDRSIVQLAPSVVLPTTLQVYFVSKGTSNVQVSLQWGILLSQLWTR